MAIKAALAESMTRTFTEFNDAYLRLQKVELRRDGAISFKLTAFASEESRRAAEQRPPAPIPGPSDDAAVMVSSAAFAPGENDAVDAAVAALKTAIYNAIKPRFDGAVDA